MNESAFVTKIPKLVTHVRNSNSLVSLSLKNGSGPCVSGPGSLGAAEPVEIAVAKVLVREQGPRDDSSGSEKHSRKLGTLSCGRKGGGASGACRYGSVFAWYT